MGGSWPHCHRPHSGPVRSSLEVPCTAERPWASPRPSWGRSFLLRKRNLRPRICTGGNEARERGRASPRVTRQARARSWACASAPLRTHVPARLPLDFCPLLSCVSVSAVSSSLPLVPTLFLALPTCLSLFPSRSSVLCACASCVCMCVRVCTRVYACVCVSLSLRLCVVPLSLSRLSPQQQTLTLFSFPPPGPAESRPCPLLPAGANPLKATG